MSLFAELGVDDDGPHAFYLGTELMKAEMAWRLVSATHRIFRSTGDAADPRRPPADLTRVAEAGHTLRAAKRMIRCR